jgi:hypothetical protein
MVAPATTTITTSVVRTSDSVQQRNDHLGKIHGRHSYPCVLGYLFRSLFSWRDHANNVLRIEIRDKSLRQLSALLFIHTSPFIHAK